ncbi:hypothetical protein BYT27DRAFT_7221923 [Phlegmacium glaucopus]|nr:hypothetical protein BYT27DRAFT_7221923 [Phlegmacium glaucopus]
MVGPLGLIVGVPGVNGPGESVADISDVFLNAGRVGKERLKIKKGSQSSGGGDAFIVAFAKFSEEHRGFVIFSQPDAVTVISERLLDGPINGLVNDAAHGWWRERNSLLVMSSSYCPYLLCWVPGVISYTNGASAVHFKCHFLAVLQSIAYEAELKGFQIMDFSEAERSGFKMAFIEFWNLLARINGAVPPNLKEAFTEQALGLLHCSNTEEFHHRAGLIVCNFPKLKPWMEWWMRPAHASMLFKSERKMEIEIWDSIPKTTNTQEAMHWKLYCMCGRDHAFLEGMYALFGVAEYYQCLWDAVSKGAPIRYVKAATIGWTKPSRALKPDEKSTRRMMVALQTQ